MAGAVQSLPPRPGVGFKHRHLDALMADPGPVAWLEVLAETYIGAAPSALAQLRDLGTRFPLSIHGIGLSIGREKPLDADYLDRLRALIDQLGPASFSEHLGWATHEGAAQDEALPLPYTARTLERVAAHVDAVQDRLGRPMLLENPATYMAFAESTWSETDFLGEIARRTGCGLLLDVNNAFISATNLGTSPRAYIDAFPVAPVGEIHLGGHVAEADDLGQPLLIDSHGQPVAEPVWALLDQALARSGPRPVLIEWDTDVPDWSVLRAEAALADAALTRAAAAQPRYTA